MVKFWYFVGVAKATLNEKKILKPYMLSNLLYLIVISKTNLCHNPVHCIQLYINSYRSSINQYIHREHMGY